MLLGTYFMALGADAHDLLADLFDKTFQIVDWLTGIKGRRR